MPRQQSVSSRKQLAAHKEKMEKRRKVGQKNNRLILTLADRLEEERQWESIRRTEALYAERERERGKFFSRTDRNFPGW